MHSRHASISLLDLNTAKGRTKGDAMSTLKKNKRIKRAKQIELYGDNKPGRGNKLSQRGKPKYLGGNGRKTTGIT